MLREADSHWLALLVDGLAAQTWGSVPSMIGAAESLAALGYLERADAIFKQAEEAIEAEPTVLNDVGVSAPEMRAGLRSSVWVLRAYTISVTTPDLPCPTRSYLCGWFSNSGLEMASTCFQTAPASCLSEEGARA